jgi:hypothetical protein
MRAVRPLPRIATARAGAGSAARARSRGPPLSASSTRAVRSGPPRRRPARRGAAVTTGPVDPWQRRYPARPFLAASVAVVEPDLLAQLAQGRRGEGLARLDEAARQREHPLHRRLVALADGRLAEVRP